MMRADNASLAEAAAGAGGPLGFSRQTLLPRSAERAAAGTRAGAGAVRSVVGERRPGAARLAAGEVVCSFAENGEAFLEQHWYHCYTCGAASGTPNPTLNPRMGRPFWGSTGTTATPVVRRPEP